MQKISISKSDSTDVEMGQVFCILIEIFLFFFLVVMIHLRTIFWTSTVWLVLLAIGYVYTAFWDNGTIRTLYPDLATTGTVASTAACDLQVVDAKLDLIQQDIMDMNQQLRQMSGRLSSAVMTGIQAPAPSVSATQQIMLWVIGSGENMVSVQRSIDVGPNQINQALSLLTKGELTSAEQAQGLRSLFDQSGIGLVGVSLDALGVLTIELSQQGGIGVGGSARVLLMRAALERTARQFDTVKSVVFKPDTILQP